MTDPKPVKMWAAYRPDGEIIHHTVASTLKCALNRLCGANWKWFKSRGYTLRCVLIFPYPLTPDPESEK